MDQIILEAHKREEVGTAKVNRLRKKGFIPGVVYGESRKTTAIQVANKDLTHLMSAHRGESFVLTLKIKDAKGEHEKSVLIKEVQYHPVQDNVIHVDFIEISLTKAIKVKVPLVAKGEAAGVKQDGGILDHVVWELDVECLPTNIPKSIEVDVCALKIGDYIQVRTIQPPEGVRIINDPDMTILSVVAPRVEVVPTAEEAAAAEGPAEPEVIKEKKDKVVEGEAGEAQEGKPAGKPAKEEKEKK